MTMLTNDQVVDLAIIAVLLIGVAQFRSVRRARAGNLIAAAALACSAWLVVYRYGLIDPGVAAAGLALGLLAGAWLAAKVNMVQIPAMIAFQHGAGALAAVLISFVELTRLPAPDTAVRTLSGVLGMVVGALTFTASMVASGKLSKRLKQRPSFLPRHNTMLLAGVALAVFLSILAARTPGAGYAYWLVLLAAVSGVLGVLFSMRVGGADMPVLISFLNATAGLAAAFCGVAIGNRLLIAAGATVAASGSILTYVMCKAMNRTLGHVLMPGKAPAQDTRATEADRGTDAQSAVSVAEATKTSDPLPAAVEAASAATSVIIVPGYGMAEGQAQHETVLLATQLVSMGKEVRFAIHPVAGRMPGHMHVLLAEADADPDLLIEIDEANQVFRNTDLVIVVGACDVVNPAAITSTGTPISGMPILRADEAHNVVVCNLDRRPGYSGVENPLYSKVNTILLLGDARVTLRQLREALEAAK